MPKIGPFWTLLPQVQLKTIQNYYFLDQKRRDKSKNVYFVILLVQIGGCRAKNLKIVIQSIINTPALLGGVGAVVKFVGEF